MTAQQLCLAFKRWWVLARRSADHVSDGMKGDFGSLVLVSCASSSLMVVLDLPATMVGGLLSRAGRLSHGDFTCGRRMVLPLTRVRYQGVPNEIDPDCSVPPPAGRHFQLGNRCHYPLPPWRTRRLPGLLSVFAAAAAGRRAAQARCGLRKILCVHDYRNSQFDWKMSWTY
jgi:hypothetical protein